MTIELSPTLGNACDHNQSHPLSKGHFFTLLLSPLEQSTAGHWFSLTVRSLFGHPTLRPEGAGHPHHFLYQQEVALLFRRVPVFLARRRRFQCSWTGEWGKFKGQNNVIVTSTPWPWQRWKRWSEGPWPNLETNKYIMHLWDIDSIHKHSFTLSFQIAPTV